MSDTTQRSTWTIVTNGALWGLVACLIGYTPLHHWQGWAVAALAIVSFELGRASR